MSFWKKLIEGESAGQGRSTSTPSSGTPLVCEGMGSIADSDRTTCGDDIPFGTPAKGALNAPTEANPEDILLERFGKIRSALGAGTVIQGKLSFDTPVRIDGKLSGEIFSSRVLIVGSAGYIDAQVDVAALVVMGSVKGNVRATDRIEVWQGGSIEGDVNTPVLVVQEGSVFSGSCVMDRVAASKATSPKAALDTPRVEERTPATPDKKDSSIQNQTESLTWT